MIRLGPHASTPASTDFLVIEMLGAPGSGKTTLEPAIEEACRSRGLTPLRAPQAGRLLASRSLLGRVAQRVVPARHAKRALWPVFVSLSYVHGLALVASQPRLGLTLLAQRRRPPGAMAGERRVVRWFLRHAGTERMFARYGHAGEVLVADEGYVHRVVQLFASPVEQPNPSEVIAYLESIPRPSLLVVLDVPSDMAAERLRARGVWARMAGLEPQEVDRFLESAAAAVEIAACHARASGWAITTIENTREAPDLETASSQVGEVLAAGPFDVSARASTRSWGLPRPGLILGRVRARLAPPPIDLKTARGILLDYGIAPSGRPAGFAVGWRSDIVSVPVDRERVVVKRYPQRWTEPGVVHEHSILGRLEEIGFPAVRLLRSGDGASYIRREGAIFAVFRFVEGMSPSGHWIRPSQRVALQARLGGTLAAFHEALEDFTPSGSHHLGYAAVDGSGPRGLPWHLGVLRDLCSHEASAADPAARQTIAWLSDQAETITDRLVTLDEVLHTKGMTTTVIHGDFGSHNVLVTASGEIVVHDLELARVDWRGIDLVSALGRLPPDVRPAFLAGYLSRSGEPAGRMMSMLPIMWQHTRLCGGVQAWHRYVESGDQSRLDLARARITEAFDVDERGVAPWR